tara:strand:+ start:359 stop:805 length:447 start_codon:yes stop_codon:yes gene_type:complete
MAGIVGLTELQHTNGNSMLTVATTGDGNVKSEGGAATTSLRQGLAKYWIDYNKSSNNNVEDSLNSSSITDNGVGDTTLTFTNNMSSNAFSAIVDNCNNTVGNSNIYVHSVKTNHKNTTNFTSFLGYDPGTVAGVDADSQSGLAHGDLA